MRTIMKESDLRELARAKYLLEHTSFAYKLMDIFGRPVEWAITALPEGTRTRVVDVSRKSIEKALHCACWTLHEKGECWKGTHLASAMGAGAVGGFFGLPGLSVELPFSTILILRSIAEIARFNGESLHALETRMACIQVFALGGRIPDDDAMNSAYLAMRFALAHEMRLATGWLARGAASKELPPVLIRMVQAVTARFSILVEEKILAQTLPVIGALGGAAINAAFMDHFQDKAEGHFTWRRLERKYGAEVVEEAYRAVSAE